MIIMQTCLVFSSGLVLPAMTSGLISTSTTTVAISTEGT